MIMYIASYKVAQMIEEAVTKADRTILNNIIQSNFCLGDFLKNQLEKIQATKTLIVDLSTLQDSDESIREALNGFRLINDKMQIIVIAPYKQPGDILLGEIFGMGIYDIITFDLENVSDNDVKEIYESLIEGKKYKDSLQYKTNLNTNVVSEDKRPKTIIKEKVIVKTEKSVSKALIGYMGVQNRIGVTHNVIVSANYLKQMGYEVAVVESNKNHNKVLETIKDMETVEEHIDEQYFRYLEVDYYPNYDVEQTYKIQAKGYNFILIDFGVYNPGMDLTELSRCIKAIVVLGGKPWEIGEANKLFANVDTTILEQYSYLFNYTAQEKQKYFIDCMGTLKNVYFADYSPNPFGVKGSLECMDMLFDEYRTKMDSNSIRQKSNFLRKVFGGRNV